MDENKNQNDSEIEKELQKFQAERAIEQNQLLNNPEKIETHSRITGWVIKNSGGFIKNERQAEYALLFFVVLALIISIVPFFTANHVHGPIPKGTSLTVHG